MLFLIICFNKKEPAAATTDINSTLFESSKILTQEQGVSLQNLINFSNTTEFTLIYQASRDGFTLNDFHFNCDNFSNTLLIIQTNQTSNIFGFFTTQNWEETDQMWQYDKDAFLFSLINQFDTSVKMNILNPANALRVYSNELDIGLELLINDEFNTSLNYGWSRSDSNSFELPSFLNNSGYLLINTYSSGFYAYEIEVYQVDGK